MALRYLLHACAGKRRANGENFGQRLGAIPPLPPKTPGVRRIWLQAVSVGKKCWRSASLLEALKNGGTSVEVYLTTTTSTGYRLALERYACCTLGDRLLSARWVAFLAAAPGARWRRIS